MRISDCHKNNKDKIYSSEFIIVIMNSKNHYLDLLGLLVLTLFTIFTFTSLILYPTPYSPLYDWLSNLGNINLNPNGAIFFNWGCIITGLILIPFIINLYRWNPPQKWSKILITIAITIGIVGAIAQIAVGVFPETHIKLHVLAATIVFSTMFLLILLLNISLYKHPKFMHIVAYWGIIAVIINLIFIFALSLPQYKNALAGFHPTVAIPGLEWATVFSALIWLALLSYNMYKKGI